MLHDAHTEWIKSIVWIELEWVQKYHNITQVYVS